MKKKTKKPTPWKKQKKNCMKDGIQPSHQGHELQHQSVKRASKQI